MFARVARYRGSKDKIEDGARFIRNDKTILQQRGFKKGYILADRSTGNVISISLWDSQESMRSSGQPIGTVRSQLNETLGGSGQPQVEEFELIEEVNPQSGTGGTTLLR